MNYLETGLPHTDFYPKKTQFSPPRYMPITLLSRKYLGLEPLTKREVGELVNRLSPPKKQTEIEEIATVKEVRPKTTGTGRFVGEKKMNSFQIEKMVSRLYSRRSTKDYAFVDETVEADDILNMTNGLDDSSDSEDESKELKERHNSYLRRQSCVVPVNKRHDNERATRRDNVECQFRRHSSFGKQCTSERHGVEQCDKGSVEIPKLKLDTKPRGSVAFSREVSVIGNKRRVSATVNDRRGCSECSNAPKAELRRSTSSGSRTAKVEAVNMCTSNNYNDEVNLQRPKSEPILRTKGVRFSNTEMSSAESSSSNASKIGTTSSTTVTTLGSTSGDVADEAKTPTSQAEQTGSPRLMGNKAPRFAVTQCDELLIDRVATYNRSPRARCK